MPWRFFKVRSTKPLPITGNGLAVDETTISYLARISGKDISNPASACIPSFWLSMRTRSNVRLSTVNCCGCSAAKYVATPSIISPAPTIRIFKADKFGQNCLASLTEAAAIDTELSPTALLLRISLVAANVFCHSPPSS